MKRLITLVLAITTSSVMIAQTCDVDGTYRVSALDVMYYGIVRDSTDLIVSDAYGLGVDVELLTLPEGMIFYGLRSGPYSGQTMDESEINLNVRFNQDDCTASLDPGSVYPDAEEENCVTTIAYLPITDIMEFTSDQTTTGPLPTTNLVGLPSVSTRAYLPGYEAGGLSLDQALVFDYFPQGVGHSGADATAYATCMAIDPTDPSCALHLGTQYITLPSPVTYPGGLGEYPANTPLPGVHGGWITTDPAGVGGTMIIAPDDTLNADLDVPDLFAEWHAIDGPASASGIDETSGDFDRKYGLEALSSATFFTQAAGCDAYGLDLPLPVAGDITETIQGGVEAGCYAQVLAGAEGTCTAAGGVQNTVYGGCVDQANGDAFAAGCAVVGVTAAVTSACVDAGGPSTAEEAAAMGVSVTCSDLGAAYDASCAGDCACAAAAAASSCEDSAGASLCCLAGGIGAATYTDCAAFAAGLSTEYLDEQAAASTGYDCPTAAAGAVAQCIASVGPANTMYVMAPSGYEAWGNFVTFNGVIAGQGIPVCQAGMAASALGEFATGDAATDIANCAAAGAACQGAMDMCAAGTAGAACSATATAGATAAVLAGAGGITEEQCNADTTCSATLAGTIAAAIDANCAALIVLDNALATDDSGWDPDSDCFAALQAFGADGVGACSGRATFTFTPQCIPQYEVRQVVIEAVLFDCGSGVVSPSSVAAGATAPNVTDVVATVAYILGNNPDPFSDDQLCAADMNNDDTVNVLDVVQMVGIILGSRAESATNVEIIKTMDAVQMKADGFVGAVQMTLNHGEDFELTLTDKALVADYNTDGNSTTLMIVSPEGNDLFTAVGQYSIETIVAASANSYINSELIIPVEFAISNAFPNPFNPSTTMTVELNTETYVSMKVFNLKGQLVDVIAEGNMNMGTHALVWDASQIASGVYFINTEVGDAVHQQKVMLMK